MATQAHDEPPRDDTPHPADAEESTGSALQKYAPSATAVSKTNETGAVMLAARARAEIESSMIVAMQRPRDIERFREVMLKACDRPIFADQAMYEKPMGKNKAVTGLSIRFAEEAARNLGNIDVSCTVIAEDDETRTLEARGVDLETNVWYRATARFAKYVERLSVKPGDEVIGSRVNSRGALTYKLRATDDQIFTEHQKAAAKATREVTLKLVPSWVKEECEERIERTMEAVGKDPAKFGKSVTKLFDRLGVSLSALEKFLGKSLALADTSELKRLKRIHTAIQQGETTWADIVGAKEAEGSGAAHPTAKGAGALKEKLNKRAPAAPAPEPAHEAAPAPVAAGRVCTECGGIDGAHKPDCKYFAD